jgi:GntR family transcriptional regulator/MocR family aminotransferase
MTAFEQLIAEGYFETRHGSGTYVARTLAQNTPIGRTPDAAPVRRAGQRNTSRGERTVTRTTPEPWLGGLGPFRVSEPAVDHVPLEVWSRLVARECRRASRDGLTYGSPMGPVAFREAVAAYLRTARAVRCEADQIMMVSGSQQALAIVARALLEPADPVWMEDPGYAGARDALADTGARLVPVPVDDNGLNVAAGIKRCERARAAYVTPSHQYPIGVTMSPARRLQLLEWARSAGAWVIEDDYDSEYRYGGYPIGALQGLDRGARVIYIGTFSKVLFPALRVGYLVIPHDLVPRFAAVRDRMDICPPALYAAALADFLAEGHFARHLRRTRAVYMERRRILVDALRSELGTRLEVVGAEAGIHLTAVLPRGSSDRTIAERAAREGLWTMPLSACYLGPPRRQGLVLGYGGTNAPDIPDAVRRLCRVIRRA